jgi:hypothetical protein
VVRLVGVTRGTRFPLCHFPLVRLMTGITRSRSMRLYCMVPLRLLVLMAADAHVRGTRLLVRLVALPALELHRRVSWPVYFCLCLGLVTFQTILSLGSQRAVLTQEVVAVKTISLAH